MLISISFSLVCAAVASAQKSAGLVALLQSQEDLSTLLSAVQSVPGLADTLAGASNITILAPTNDAFDAIPAESTVGIAIAGNDTDVIEALLTYHVLKGNFTSDTITTSPAFLPSSLTDTAFTKITNGQAVQAAKSGDNVVFTSGRLTNSTVTEADIIAGGITVHKIDTVLSIPQNTSSNAIAAGLTSLAGALTQADLVKTVDITPHLTIFAPNDAAFQAVGSALMNASIETLQQVLSYHVVKGSILYSPHITNTSVKSLSGGEVTLNVVDGTVFVNSAKVVMPNVLVANGVVHVIDSVLNPNSTSAPSEFDPSSKPSVAFSGASSVSGALSTPGLPSASTAVTASTGVEDSSPTSAGATSAAAVGAGGRAAATGMAGAIGAGALFAGAWVGF